MAQYASRIHIKVCSSDVWNRFIDEDDASFDLATLAAVGTTSFVLESDWARQDYELEGIVSALAKTLGSDGIIIADTTNLNVDTYDYCVYYLGGNVDADFAQDEELFYHVSIHDIAKWLTRGKFPISSAEKDHLYKFGIISVGKHFEDLPTELNVPSKTYVRETSFCGRPETIEQLHVGEEVYFVYSRSAQDPTRLEVMSSKGSIGYLHSDVSDSIAPFLLSRHLHYTAHIVELIPLSQRNPHAKSPIVALSIDAAIIDTPTSAKKSILSIDRNA